MFINYQFLVQCEKFPFRIMFSPGWMYVHSIFFFDLFSDFFIKSNWNSPTSWNCVNFIIKEEMLVNKNHIYLRRFVQNTIDMTRCKMWMITTAGSIPVGSWPGHGTMQCESYLNVIYGIRSIFQYRGIIFPL